MVIVKLVCGSGYTNNLKGIVINTHNNTSDNVYNIVSVMYTVSIIICGQIINLPSRTKRTNYTRVAKHYDINQIYSVH